MKLDSYTKRRDLVPREAPIAAHLPWLQLLPEDAGGGAVVCKSGAFLAGLEIDLVPFECVPDDELEARSAALENVLRTTPDGCEIQLEVVRDAVRSLRVPHLVTDNDRVRAVEAMRRTFLRQTVENVLENKVTAYLCHDPGRREAGRLGFLRTLLWPELKIRHFRQHEHQKALADFRGRVAAVQSALRGAGLSARSLADEELLGRLRAGLDPAGTGTQAPGASPWSNLSHRIPCRDIVIEVDHLRFGASLVAVLSASTLPDSVYPFNLASLVRLPWRFRLVMGIDMVDQARQREKQQSKLRWNFALSDRSMGGKAAAPDVLALNKTQAHRAVLDQMQNDNRKLLPVSFTMVIPARSNDELEDRVRTAQSRWAQKMKGSELLREELGAWPAFCASLPGGLCRSGRKLSYLSHQVADMAVGLFGGHASRGWCGRTTFRDREGGLVPFSLFDGDKDLQARNVLMFAPMGSGKSMLLLNLIVGELTNEPAPMVRIIDIGGSTSLIPELFGGVTQRFSLASGEHTDVVNPCDVPELDDQSLAFLMGFIAELVETLSRAEEGMLAEVLKAVYSEKSEPGAVILSDIEKALVRHADPRMKEVGARLKYVTAGPYGRLLNRHSTHHLDRERIAYYDFQDCAHDDRLVRILMQAVTHDALAMAHRVGPAVPKILAMDEAWRILESKAGATLVKVGARTARKLRMSFIVVSQSLGDFCSAELRDSIVNNAEMQFILPGPREKMETLAEVFKLNEAEIDRVRSLRRVKGGGGRAGGNELYTEIFFIRPQGRQVLRFTPPPFTFWMAASDPDEKVLRAQVIAEREGDRWKALEWLAANHPRGLEAAGIAGAGKVKEEELLPQAVA